MPGPEMPAPQPEDMAGAQGAPQGGEYDHLFDPNIDLSQGTVEDAAVRPEVPTPETVAPEVAQAQTAAAEAAAVREPKTALPPAQTSHRPGYWQPPTDAQVANAARYGFDLSQQRKYFE